jgi:Family of unknown function (DUF6056)
MSSTPRIEASLKTEEREADASGMATGGSTQASKESATIHRLLLWAPSAAIVGLFAWVGRWVYWVADDFCRGASARDLGLIGIQTAEYQNWSGRYTFNALIGLATRFGLNASQLAPPIIAALSVVIFTALARKLPAVLLPSGYAPLFGAFGCLGLFGLYENFGQSVLWLTGGLTYILPFLLFASALLFAFPNASNPRLAAGSQALASVLMFLAVGCNEAIGAAIVGGLIAGAMFGGKKLRWNLLPVLAFSLLGFAIMAAAPGNNTRRTFIRPRKLSEVPIQAVTDTLRLFVWLLSQRTLLVFVAVGVGLTLARTLGKRHGLGLLSGSLLVGIPLGIDLLALIGTGNRLVQRARIAAVVPMLVGIVLFSWFTRAKLPERSFTTNRKEKTRFSLFLAFAIAICAARSVVPAAAAARNSAPISEQTTNLLVSGRGTTVPIAIPGPGTIWGLANFQGDGDWALRCADSYFNVKGTYLESNSQPPRTSLLPNSSPNR